MLASAIASLVLLRRPYGEPTNRLRRILHRERTSDSSDFVILSFFGIVRTTQLKLYY